MILRYHNQMNPGTQSTLKITQINTENLFIYLDHYDKQNLDSLSEPEWQNLSTSVVANKPLRKTKWLAESLRHLDPDIIILSEVGGVESLENFNSYFLDGNFHVFLKEGNSQRGIDVGYLVHKRWKKNFLLLSHKNRALNFNYPHERIWNQENKDNPNKKQFPSHRFSRDISELRVFNPDTQNLEFIFLSCHLKSKLDKEGIDPGGFDRRQAEFETLLKIYNDLLLETESKVPILIAGDFNGCAQKSNPDPEFKTIQSTDLIDTLELMNIDKKNRATRFDYRSGTVPVGHQLDYIFMSKHLQNQVKQSFVFRYKSENGAEMPPITSSHQQFVMPSDHYPIFLELNPL